MRVRVTLLLVLLSAASATMAVDVASLWDYNRPELSERRFTAALRTAVGDDALILKTQLARTYGLRHEFIRAQEILQSIERDVATAGPEARARYALELGRTYASATHPPQMLTPEANARARDAYRQALSIARDHRLDALAVDALHMLAFVDTAPADQLYWDRQALAVVQASTQPDAKTWEASVRNNLGVALFDQGRYDDALVEFRQALALREGGGDPDSIRIARWMVAWALRALGRTDDALDIQLRLEREFDAAASPQPDVYEELNALYRAKGDAARALHYEELKRQATK
jgi:tetratricopeptide (TPR) repeat protein